MFTSENPVSNEILRQYPFEDQYDNKLEVAEFSYLKFSSLPLSDRVKLIGLFAQELNKNIEKLSLLITLEMGKPIMQSRAEIAKSVSLCNYYCQHAGKQLKPVEIIENDLKAKVYFTPLGVLLGIMPWNFPVWQTLRFCIPAITAGNVVLLKPAPNVPQTSLYLEELFKRVFKEFNVFQVIMIDTDQVSKLIENPIIKGVSITGSAKAGASVAALAGQSIKKSVLELGGSDPFVVCKDADLKLAAQFAIKSRMNNTGQTCIAAKRIIVQQDIYERFIGLLKAEVSSQIIGDPINENTQISTLARKDLRENLQRQLDESIGMGANPIIKGGSKTGKGYYFEPVLLDHISTDMPVYLEEIFGPVAIVFPFDSIDDALRISNDTDYGLGACIWTNDEGIRDHYTMNVQAGFVSVNDFVTSDPRLPFGGIKKSGYGRELGAEGIKEFVNVKTVNYH